MKVQPRFRDPEKVFLSSEKRCPFNRGNKYKDYVNINFPGANFVSPLWRCPLNRSDPKEKFHCTFNLINVGILLPQKANFLEFISGAVVRVYT